MMPVNKRITEV
jgi:hypothetical protein